MLCYKEDISNDFFTYRTLKIVNDLLIFFIRL